MPQVLNKLVSPNDLVVEPDLFVGIEPVILDNDKRLYRMPQAVYAGEGAPGYVTRYTDDFSEDRLFTIPGEYDSPVGTTGVLISGGVVNQTTSSSRIFLLKTSILDLNRYPRLTSKLFTGTVMPSSGFNPILSWVDSQNYIYCGLVGTSFRITKLDANTATILKSTTTSVAAGSTVWQRGWRDADGYCWAELWTTDPALGGSPAYSLSHQLGASPGVAGDYAKFNIPTQVGWRGAQTTGNGWTMDDFKVELLVGQNGDYYRDILSGYAYGPKTNDSWGAQRSLSNVLTWFTLPLATNWSSYGSGFADGGYTKDSNGMVMLRGTIKKSTAVSGGETISTLPLGYRPASHRSFAVRASSGTEIHGAITVRSDGTVAYTTGAANLMGLDGIIFDAA